MKPTWDFDCGLSGLNWQDNHGTFEPILAEVTIKGESMIESMIVDQSETSAIDEAEVFVIVSNENHLHHFFNGLVNAKNFDAGERLHECDGGSMTDLEPDHAIGLGEDEIGG
jgi:hypothetical protein